MKGESTEARRNRIRQFEDFFNVPGLGTPDDLVEFREQQKGFQAHLGIGATFHVAIKIGVMRPRATARF